MLYLLWPFLCCYSFDASNAHILVLLESYPSDPNAQNCYPKAQDCYQFVYFFLLIQTQFLTFIPVNPIPVNSSSGSQVVSGSSAMTSGSNADGGQTEQDVLASVKIVSEQHDLVGLKSALGFCRLMVPFDMLVATLPNMRPVEATCVNALLDEMRDVLRWMEFPIKVEINDAGYTLLLAHFEAHPEDRDPDQYSDTAPFDLRRVAGWDVCHFIIMDGQHRVQAIKLYIAYMLEKNLPFDDHGRAYPAAVFRPSKQTRRCLYLECFSIFIMYIHRPRCTLHG